MLKVKIPLILHLSLLLLTGCASTQYSTFTGSQVWPTTKDAVASQKYAVPVYWSWPEHPYRVIGSIQIAEPQQELGNHEVARSAREASSRGGNGLIVPSGETMGLGQDSVPAMKLFPTASTRALVIQWKSQSEVEEGSHRLDGLRAYMKRSYPALQLGNKNDLWDMSVEYVTWLGLDINTPSGAGKVEEVLSSLVAQDVSSSKRLFKGTLRTKTSAGQPTESVVYGIATITSKDSDVAIISQPGTISVDFHGSRSNGQLLGQLNFASGSNAFTGKAEGSISPGKILLSCQWQFGGKPVQGAFIFLQ